MCVLLMKKNILLLLMLQVVLLFSCGKDDSNNNAQEMNKNYVINEKLISQVYYLQDSSEEQREDWSFNENGLEIGYSLYEDEVLIQKHVNYKYTVDYDEVLVSYTQDYFANGDNTPYYSKNITKV